MAVETCAFLAIGAVLSCGLSRAIRCPPSPRCAVPGKGACADPLCLPCPSPVQCFGRGIAGAGRAELSALELPALCGAGADLQPLRRNH
jgi:hypothetical protein